MNTFWPSLKSFFRKKPEPTYSVDGEDPAMQAAIREAQATFPDFIAEVQKDRQRIVPALEEALVKYMFPMDSSPLEFEHMFLSDLDFRGATLFGTLTSEPIQVRNRKAGDVVAIESERVSDWLYVADGKGTGGFTFKVMWSRFTHGERRKYRQAPPFCWLDVA